MALIERMQTLIMLAAIGFGFLIGRLFPHMGNASGGLITPALMAMLYGLFLGIPLTDLKAGFMNFKFTTVSLIINFLWVPLLGWWLGGIFLSDSPALRLGYLMLLVTPCTDWYLVFTGLARGNVALSTALLPVNLLVQIVLLPVYLLIFSGLTGRVDLELLGRSIILVLILPFGLAQLTRRWRNAETRRPMILERIFSGGQFWFLCLAIMAMFASQAGQLSGNTGIFLKLLLPVTLFFIINFGVGRLAARLMNFSFEDSVSLNLTTLARNSPIALAIAVTAFPHEPLIALALVIGPLIELPFLGLIARVLLLLRPPDRAVDPAD